MENNENNTFYEEKDELAQDIWAFWYDEISLKKDNNINILKNKKGEYYSDLSNEIKNNIVLKSKNKIKLSFLNKDIDKKISKKSLYKKFIFIMKKMVKNLYSHKKILISSIFILFLLLYKSFFELTYLNIQNNIKKIEAWENTLDEIKSLDSNLFLTKTMLFPAKIFLINPIYTNKHFEVWYNLLSWWKDLTSWVLKAEKLIKKINLNSLDNNFIKKNEREILVILRKIKAWTEKISYSNWLLKDNKLNLFWYNEKIEKIGNYALDLNKKVDFIEKDFYQILDILWENWKKRYAIIMQNADEIRPTWWFIWSILFVSFEEWQITEFKSEDVYALEWKIKPYSEKAPEWLNRLKNNFWLENNFWLRDSNYFIETSLSAEKIKFFLLKAWEKVDGIAFINNNIISEILWEIGEIELETGEKFNGENFSTLMSILVESKKYKDWRLWTPKKILFDFIERFKDKIDSNPKILAILLKNIYTRDIALYSFNFSNNKFLSNIWVNWELDFDKHLDFSYPYFTSISWNKSDRYVNKNFEKTYNILDNCKIETSLKIELNHNFSVKDEEKIRKEYYNLWNNVDLKNQILIQWKWENRQFVRVLIPKNAEILNNNLTQKRKNNYKEIQFYMYTKPGQKTEKEIKYEIKNEKCEEYSYKFYKQPWIKSYNLKVNQFNFDKIKKDFIFK